MTKNDQFFPILSVTLHPSLVTNREAMGGFNCITLLYCCGIITVLAVCGGGGIALVVIGNSHLNDDHSLAVKLLVPGSILLAIGAAALFVLIGWVTIPIWGKWYRKCNQLCI
jgi:hypothetical protein